MKLLPIDLEPFARMTWNSAAARDYWRPKFNAAQSLYWRLERETVAAGLRGCTTWNMTPERMAQDLNELARMGLHFIPIKTVARYQGFAHKHVYLPDGSPNGMVYGAVCKYPDDGYAFREATLRPEGPDHVKIGELLGYPSCCRVFFDHIWREEGVTDPVWHQALNSAGCTSREGALLTVEGNPLLNVALRYFGIRFCPMLPESYDCPEAIAYVKQWEDIAFQIDKEAAEAMLVFLELPMEWNVLKGYGIVNTPLFRGHFNSVPCYPKHTVRYTAKDPRYFDWNTLQHASAGTEWPYTEFTKNAKLNRAFQHVVSEEDLLKNLELAKQADAK